MMWKHKEEGMHQEYIAGAMEHGLDSYLCTDSGIRVTNSFWQ